MMSDRAFNGAMTALCVATAIVFAVAIWHGIVHGDDEENACKALGDGYSYVYDDTELRSTGKTVIAVDTYVCVKRGPR